VFDFMSLKQLTGAEILKFQMPMMMGSFQQREYQPPQPRMNGGNAGYNRRSNRNHQQMKGGEQQQQQQPHQQVQQQNGKDLKNVQHQQVMTNGVNASEQEPVEQQMSQLNIKQEQPPITA